MDVILNDKQLAVLSWIADGCPAGVYDGETHKLSARMLHRHGLARISGRGPTWQALITDAGQAHLADPPTPAPTRPRPARKSGASSRSADAVPEPRALTKTEQLVADVLAAGGRLELPDETARGGVNWRQRAYAAQRHGKVPDGKHLTVSWNKDGFVIELRDGATGNELGVDVVHVPARLTKYHRVARQFRDRTSIQQISRKALPRALRIIHALAMELERRGHHIECVTPNRTDNYGRSDYKPNHDGQLVVTINGHDLKLRIWEKGCGLRGPWEQQKQHYEERRLDFRGGYYPSRPEPFDKDATGELNIKALGYSPRKASWGDRKRWTLEDRLGQVLRELETQAEEAEERRLQREREATEQQRQWEQAMATAKVRLVDDHRRTVLADRVRAWQEADAIRAYCDAVEERHGAAAMADGETSAWLELARQHADQLQELPRMPADPEITHEALKPYLGRWSPYGPDRRW